MLRLFAFGLLLFSNFIVGHAMADAIGTVVASSGSAIASGPGGSRALNGGASVFEHDKITVSSGNAQILLLDGTKLVVGPNSALVLEKFLMKGGATAQNVSVDALRGTFRFITGKSPKSAYRIQTSNATIGIRGTGFDFWVAERTGVALLQGQVKLCSKKGGRTCVELQPNCSIGVAGDPAPAHIIKGAEKSTLIDRRLPFIVNQTPLRSQFRLNTGNCSQSVMIWPESHERPTKNGGKNGAKNGASAPKHSEEPKKEEPTKNGG